REFMGHKVSPWKWEAPILWKLETEQAKQKPESSALVKAGDRLYGHAGKLLLALDLPSGGKQPRVAWQQQIDGVPSSMIVGDGKLFVVTKEGGLYCFGASPRTPTIHESKPLPPPSPGDKWAARAAEILRHAGATDGYGLVLGLGTGRLMEELLQQSQLRVIGVDADAAKVRAIRDKLVAAGFYGTRAEVFVGPPFDFPFPPYLATLIVSEGLDHRAMDVPVGKVFEALRPYGGVACLEVPTEKQNAFADWVGRRHLERAEVTRTGDFALLRRFGPLPGSAPWTHEAADTARTYFSRDQRVKPPLGILWYGDVESGLYERNDYDSGLKPQVAGGRLFAFQVPTNTLFGYDAYTGRLCWKRKFDRSTRYASMDDGVYVAVGDRCLVCDAATGKELATFQYDVGQPAFAKDIRVSDDIILIGVSSTETTVIGKGLWDSTMLVALDRKTGKLLWKKQAEERFNKLGIALGGGMVFCIDSLSPIESERTKVLVEKPTTTPSTLTALDARTGETKWTAATTHPFRMFKVDGGLSIRGYD
ncbi:MAG: PQQ-like beta-propeller repeat protein, partial [Planctomycetes bacterium]|nr:PQQ-like beta-propeller repeat protein [Planctomycetota bacterium]